MLLLCACTSLAAAKFYTPIKQYCGICRMAAMVGYFFMQGGLNNYAECNHDMRVRVSGVLGDCKRPAPGVSASEKLSIVVTK